MKTAKGKDNGCGTRRWAGNSRPAPTAPPLRDDKDVYVYGGGGRGNLRENREDPTPTVGVGGDVYPIKTMRHWLGRVFVGGQATHGLPLQRCSYAMIWIMGVYGGGGRGNLRENREDPAPTVGVGGEVDPIKNDAAL